MSEYLLSIIGIVFISGIVSSILPEGKTASAVRATAKLCCLLVILTPVAEFALKGGGKEKIFSDFLDENVIQTDETFINYCSRKRIEETQTYLKEKLQREYGVELDVELVWEYAVQEMEHYSAEEIRVLEILLYSLEEVDEIQKQEMIDKLKTDCGVEVRWVEK